MNISHIEHIGIAVKSMEEAITYYEDILGLKCYAVEEVADQKVKTAFFMVGQTKIELLESTVPKVLSENLLRKKAKEFIILLLQLKYCKMHLTKSKSKEYKLIDKKSGKVPKD